MGKKPGSPKGQSKPVKRKLDNGFAGRLKIAMGRSEYNSNPALAERVGCTRQTIHNYVTGEQIKIDAHLLFEIADALEVDARWLLVGKTKPAVATKPIKTIEKRELAYEN